MRPPTGTMAASGTGRPLRRGLRWLSWGGAGRGLRDPGHHLRPPAGPGRGHRGGTGRRRANATNNSSSRGRSFRRGDAAAVLDPAEDMGAAPLGRPPLAFEHLEHGDLFCRQGIALDRLQVCGFGQQPVRGGTRGGIGMMLRPGHGGTVPRCGGEGSHLHHLRQ